MTEIRVLVIDDETIAAMYTQILVEGAGYTVVGNEMRGEEAIANASRTQPHSEKLLEQIRRIVDR